MTESRSAVPPATGEGTEVERPAKERIETDAGRTLEAALRLAVLAEKADVSPALRYQP